MPVLRSARALAEAPITTVKKNPIDAKVKSLQDQLAAVSLATSAVSDSTSAPFSSLTCATSAQSDLISFSSRSF